MMKKEFLKSTKYQVKTKITQKKILCIHVAQIIQKNVEFSTCLQVSMKTSILTYCSKRKLEGRDFCTRDTASRRNDVANGKEK